jgi:hypothetical protein
MAKYKFKYVYERWYDLEIEAESEEKAREMFENADFKGEPRLVGGEIQPDYEVEEVNE